MYRIQMVLNGQIAYTRDVSTQAYARVEARELASAAGESVEVEHDGDLARFNTPTGFVRAFQR